MTPSHASQSVTFVEKCRWTRGKRELGIELRNHLSREPALLLERIGERDQGDMTSADVSRRSRRPHANVDVLCTRTGIARMVSVDVADRQGKVCDHNPCMYATGKSDIGNSTCESIEQNRPAGSGDGGGKYR